MDEENSDAPRVTRARTRRLSVLDTDSRPLTPLLDITADRASPRPTRRTRLNSTTIDLRTPTRATRSSVARGETPEPATPTPNLPSVKRSTRTPAKSVRKQLPLAEDDIEEESNQNGETKAEPNNAKMDVVTEVAEIVVVDSTSNSPERSTSAMDASETPYTTSPVDKRRVTRSMSKTPPVPGRAVIDTPPKQSDTKNSVEEKLKQSKESIKIATEIVDSSPVDGQKSLLYEIDLTDESIGSPKVKENEMSLATPKVKVKVKDILVGIQETATEHKNAKVDKELNNLIVIDDVDPMVVETEQSGDKEDVTAPQSADATIKPVDEDISTGTTQSAVATDKTADEDISTATTQSADATDKPADKDISTDTTQCTDATTKPADEYIFKDTTQSVEPAVEPSNDETSTDVQVTEDISLSDLTPNSKTRLVEPRESPPIKTVVFNNNTQHDDAVKPKYPKTPARVIASQGDVFSIAEGRVKIGTPLKPIILKGRNSSTPLSKIEPVQNQASASNEPSHPPPKIDMIKPFSELENSAPEIETPKEKPLQLFDSRDEEDEQHEEEMEKDPVCEFFDNEVEVIDNYQSGDSMDSSERREIENNEVPHDGESVGSQDTTDEHSEDSADEKMSFIVSDNEDDDGVGDEDEAENEDNDGDGSDIESLCFSSASEEEDKVVSMQQKKRRRIIVHDSSDEEEQNKTQPNIEKDAEVTESKVEKSITKEKNISVTKEDADKLEIKASEKSLHLSACENSPESKSNKSERLNKTAPALVGEEFDKDEAMDIEEVLSSSNECEKKEAKDNVSSKNKTIYEVSDSGEESRDNFEKDISLKQAAGDEDIPTTEIEQQFEIEKVDPVNESSKAINENPDDTTLSSTSDGKNQELDVNPVPPTSESSAFHIKQKREEEAELLTELASCDLSHLRQMFNPLQKSRRQTLYVQDPQMTAKEPKLKRRSEQLSSDVKPSQSFVETLDEEKRRQSKRKRLSKSFCGAVEDALDTSVLTEVQRKKPKMALDDKPASDSIEIDEPLKDVNVETPDRAAIPQAEAIEELKETVVQRKTRDDYLDYCDAIIQAANEAKLEQKKQRNAACRNQKKTVSEPANDGPITIVTANLEVNKPTTIKKKVKRLQATKQAVKHAMQLLAPDAANKEPQSLARKLSPQPEVNAKGVRVKQQQKKKHKLSQPQPQVSPVKSSDEENHRAPKRIKTSAGYVTVINKRRERRPIETFKISSGLVKVEPCTPTHKYFKEIPATPTTRSGFKEMPATPKSSKNRSTSARNPATEAALRFKREMFGRNYK